MEVKEGKIGRVFALKLSNGEDVLAQICKVAKEKKVRGGMIFILGGLKDARLVTGPEKTVIPPEPHFEKLGGEAREIFGTGTIYWEGDEAKVHLHVAAGRGTSTFAGCLRGESSVFCVNEVVMLELGGIRMTRKPDPANGLSLLSFE